MIEGTIFNSASHCHTLSKWGLHIERLANMHEVFHANIYLRPTKMSNMWFKTTLNYWTMLKRYPNLKEEGGGFDSRLWHLPSLLDINLPGGQLSLVLWRWPVDLLSQKKIKIRKMSRMFNRPHSIISGKASIGYDTCQYEGTNRTIFSPICRSFFSPRPIIKGVLCSQNSWPHSATTCY